MFPFLVMKKYARVFGMSQLVLSGVVAHDSIKYNLCSFCVVVCLFVCLFVL